MALKQFLNSQPPFVLSLLLLSGVGCLVFLLAGTATLHDRAVVAADARCYRLGEDARRARVAARLDALEKQSEAERASQVAAMESRLSAEGPSPADVELYAELDARNDLTNAQMATYMVLDQFCQGRVDGLASACNVDAAGRSRREWVGTMPKWMLALIGVPGPLLLVGWTLASRRRWRVDPAA